MYQSDLLKKNSRLNQSKQKSNYDQTVFPRINETKFSVYKIEEERQFIPPASTPYVIQTYWDNYYTEDQLL